MYFTVAVIFYSQGGRLRDWMNLSYQYALQVNAFS